MEFILNWHPFIVIIILSIITVSISYIGLKYVRKKFAEEVLIQNHEVGSFIFNAFGLIYAVLVAFVVYVTWSEYNDSQKNTDLEVIKLTNVYNFSNTLPDNVKQQTLVLLNEYINSVINEEWKELADMKHSENTTLKYKNLVTYLVTLNSDSLNNKFAYHEMLMQLDKAGECRKTRIFDSVNNIPSIMWFVLIFGALVTIIYTYFFFTKNLNHQFVMTSTLTVLNTMILYMIYVFDNPYRGYLKLKYSALIHLLDLINNKLM